MKTQTDSNKTLNKDSIKSVKAAIKSVAKSLNLSDYMRRKIQKSELEQPHAWGTFPDGDNSYDARVQRYYNAVEAIYDDRVSASCYTNIFLDFKEEMLRRYGISISVLSY